MPNNEPLVTIIIGAYKRSSSLEQTIESVLNQSYRNFKFYLVEDNQPDDIDVIEGTKEIISKFNDSRLIHIRNSINIGVPFVYKKWLDLVKSKYYLIGGDGDIFENDTIQKYVNFLEDHPRSSLVYGLEKFRKNNGAEYEIQHFNKETGEYSAFEHLQFHLIGGRNNYGWGYAMYRSDFYKVKNIRVSNYHYWDHYFHCTYLLFSENVGFINEYLAIRHVDTDLKTWAQNKPFINRLERLIQTSKFIDEYETYLIRKGYPTNKYRLINALRIFRRLGYCKKADEFHFAFRIAFIDTASVLLTGFVRLVAYPFLKLFSIIRKN